MQIVTQGGAITLPFTLESAPGTPHDLTGASFETKIIGSDGAVDTFDNDHHSIVDTAEGEMELELSAVETAALKVGLREVLVKVTQNSVPVFFRSWCLTVKPATPEG